MAQRLRPGIVGAGNISEFHIAAVRDVPEVELVGLTDLDPARAEATGARLGVTVHRSLEELVAAGANVIHVLTPPHAHAPVALEAIGLGCHVLVEKPLAEDGADARRIGAAAAARGVVATVNHSLLYDPQVLRALRMARSGALGRIVGVDILRGSEYPPFEGGPLPPHYRTAGYPFRDLGVHCLYLIQEFLGPIASVGASWRSLGGDPNLAFDEWRAIAECRDGMGAFQLSWNAKPMQSQLIVHGTRGIFRVDLFAMTHGKRGSTPLPKAAERLINTFTDSFPPLVDTPIAVWKVLRKKVRAYQGLRNLVADFYRRLAAGEAPPVTIEDAAVVVDWVEHVARAADAEHAEQRARFTLSSAVPFLVTGASGSLGGAVVERLRHEGHRVRALVRRLPACPRDGVEYAVGNLGDAEAVDRAVRGAEVVIHAGAAMKGGWPEHLGGTVAGTRNVIEACLTHGVRQLVHISSMSVVDWAGSSGGAPVSEATALEPRAGERGAYTRAKLEAERLVSEAVTTQRLPAVIFRPGQIFGGGIPLITGAVARGGGTRWTVLGDGRLVLPLVYIDDVVDAILAAVERRLTAGEVIQVIDPEALTQREVLAVAGGGKPVRRVPRWLVFTMGAMTQPLFGLLRRQSPVAAYRLRSALARLTFASDRARLLLGWTPRVGVREGIARVAGKTARPVT
jgi:predicted dehydrogenase/nucleoside-diphosphate-sugar epimerase